MAMTQEKPLIWLRIEATDEARCDSEEKLAIIKPDWKVAQKEMNDAEEALLDAQCAARERFPDCAYDEQSSKALSSLTKDFEDKTAKYRKLDSKKRHFDDESKKLRDAELKMISEARDPDLFAGGENLGPNGWQRVRLRDLTGAPDPGADPEKVLWPAMELERHGYDTVHQFLQGRGRLIGALLDDGEIAQTTLEQHDRAVYRYLERRKLLDHWPKGVEAPKGEQMTILQVQPEPAEPKAKGKKAKAAPEPAQAAPKPEPATTPDTLWHRACALFPMPKASDLAPVGADKDTIDAVRLRTVQLMVPWETMGEDHEVLFALTDDETHEVKRRLGLTPYDAVPALLMMVFADKDIEPLAIDQDKLSRMVTAWMLRAHKVGQEAGLYYDELTQWLMRKIIEHGAEAVRRLAVWSPDLGAAVAAFRDSDHYAVYEPKPTPIEEAASKAGTKSKKKTKKKTSKKQGKKTTKKTAAKK